TQIHVRRTKVTASKPKQKKQQSEKKASESFLRHASVLVVVCFAAYANSLTGEFVWDDKFQVVRNETIRTFANLQNAFSSSLWAFMYSEGGSVGSVFNRY